MPHDDGPERGVRRGNHVPAGELNGHPGVERPGFQDRDLRDTVIVGRLRQLGEELGRGERLRQDLGLFGKAGLGDAKGGMDDRCRVDLASPRGWDATRTDSAG